MIIVCIALCVGFGLAIKPAREHDRNLPVSVTGKARK